jgi:DNA topoisomerase IB
MATREKEQATVEKQVAVDAIMSDAFREHAGSEDTTSRAVQYGYGSTQVRGVLYS